MGDCLIALRKPIVYFFGEYETSLSIKYWHSFLNLGQQHLMISRSSLSVTSIGPS